MFFRISVSITNKGSLNPPKLRPFLCPIVKKWAPLCSPINSPSFALYLYFFAVSTRASFFILRILKLLCLLEIFIIFPLLGFNFCCKNSGKLTFPIKQSPWESFFLAVVNFCLEAIERTSDLFKCPIGNIIFSSCF